MEELSVTDTQLGVTFGAAGVLAAIAGAITGLCTDYIGGKRMMVIGWVLQPLVFTSLIFYSYFPAIYSLGLIVLSTALASVCAISSQAFVKEMTKRTEYMEGFSKLRFFQNAGYLIGPPLGSFAVLYGWAKLFLIVSLLSIIPLFSSIKIKNKHKEKNITKIIKIKTLLNTKFFIFYIASALSMMAYSALTTVLPATMVSDMSFNPGYWTVLATINSAIVIFFQIPFGKKFKNYNMVSILIFSSLLLGLPYVSLVFSSSFFLLLAVVVSNAFGEVGWGPAFQTQAITMSPSHQQGLCLGVLSSTLPIGLSLGPFFGFFLKDTYGVSFSWGFFTMCGILSSCLLLAIAPNSTER